MYQVELIQTRGDNEGMSIRGAAGALPQAGESFGMLFGKPNERSAISTTPVLHVDEIDGVVFFETRNSSYLLRVMKSAEESVA